MLDDRGNHSHGIIPVDEAAVGIGTSDPLAVSALHRFEPMARQGAELIAALAQCFIPWLQIAQSLHIERIRAPASIRICCMGILADASSTLLGQACETKVASTFSVINRLRPP